MEGRHEQAEPSHPWAGSSWRERPRPEHAVDGSPGHHRIVLDATLLTPGRARRFVGPLLRGFDQTAREDVLLMVSELVTNAVIHVAGRPDPREIGLDVHLTGGVTVTVTDPGHGFDPAALTGPRPGVPGARGLQLVEFLSDDRGIDGRDPFRVWFTRRR